MEERQLQQLVVIGLGLTIIVGLALVLGLVLTRWGDPNRGANTKLNLLHQVPDEYTRTRNASLEPRIEGGLDPSWQPGGNVSTTYQVYVAHGCASCHGLAGQGATVGGAIAGLDGDIIRFFVRNGPGGMPAYVVEELSDEHLDAIVAWSSGQGPVGERPPEVPHSLEGRTDCLLCHDTGSIRPFPPDHTGRGIDVCLVCHKSAGLPSATPTPWPTPPFATSTPAPTSQPGGEAPAIPHALEDRADCLLCHGTGSLRPYPADHAGRSSDICLACHQPAGRPGTTPTPTPTRNTMPASTPTATPTPVREPKVPNIPHTLEGRSDCLLCHNTGSIQPFPRDHVGRTNEICLLCHQPE